MTLTREELRDELRAVTAARHEVSRADEQYLIDGFLDKLDAEIDSRIDARIGTHKSGRSGGNAGIAALALVMALPLSFIAVFAGWQGLLVTWAAVLIVVFLTTRR